tara:strand:+ start:88 stop:507 length:420 start_codon:yes stop_codon:yes gene_type:complete
MIQTINKLARLFSKEFLILIFLIILVLTAPIKKSYAFSYEWVEVPVSKNGKQFWDKKSIKRNKDGSLRVISKFIPKTKSEITDNILYTMDINCLEKLFKDVAVKTDQSNEFVQSNLGWEKPNGDQLISGVIGQVCNYEN